VCCILFVFRFSGGFAVAFVCIHSTLRDIRVSAVTKSGQVGPASLPVEVVRTHVAAAPPAPSRVRLQSDPTTTTIPLAWTPAVLPQGVTVDHYIVRYTVMPPATTRSSSAAGKGEQAPGLALAVAAASNEEGDEEGKGVDFTASTQLSRVVRWRHGVFWRQVSVHASSRCPCHALGFTRSHLRT